MISNAHATLFPQPVRRRPSRTRSLPASVHPSHLESIIEEYEEIRVKLDAKESTPIGNISLKLSESGNGSWPLSESVQKQRTKLRIRTKESSFDCDRYCAICFDSAVRPLRTRCCGNLFCEDHLHDWLNRSSNHCPICQASCDLQTGTISLASPLSPTVSRDRIPPPLSLAHPPHFHAPSPRPPFTETDVVSLNSQTVLFPMLHAVNHSLNQTLGCDNSQKDSRWELVNSPAESEISDPNPDWSPPSWYSSCRQESFSPNSYFSFEPDRHRPPSPFPLFSPNMFLPDRRLSTFGDCDDVETLRQNLTNIASKMLGQALGVIGMVLVLHVLLGEGSSLN